jgi:hypothetical protein
MESEAIPLLTEPVILLTELKAPAMVCVTSEPAPYTNPKPPSSGPLVNPSTGRSMRSVIPVEMLLKSPTGLPNRLSEPSSFRTYFTP